MWKNITCLTLGCLLWISCEKKNADLKTEGKGKSGSSTQNHRHRDASHSADAESVKRLLVDFLAEGDPGDFLLKALQEDEGTAIRMLGQLEGNRDYEKIREILLTHFEGAKLEDLIQQFRFLEPNRDLAIPLWGQALNLYWAEQPDQAVDFLLKYEGFSGAANAAKMLGQRMGSAKNAKEDFEQVLACQSTDGIKKNLLQGIAQNWVKHDFEEAFKHVSELEPGPLVDQTFYTMVNAGSKVDAEGTMPWAQAIDNPGLQRSAILENAIMWQSSDQEAYYRWKKEAKIPDDLLKELP